LKIVWIIFGETKSACVSGRPVSLESEEEILLKVIWVLKLDNMQFH